MIGLALILALIAAYAAGAYLGLRARLKRRGVFGPFPVRKTALAAFDPVFAEDAYGPSLAAEVVYVGRADTGPVGGTTDKEAWVLAVLAKRARLMVEFGTATGKTAYLWARNSPPDARVVTMTLAPEQALALAAAAGDDARAAAIAARESAFTRFLYTGTPAEAKITQLFLDSKAFDEEPYRGKADLVFVDGSHARSYVESDTAKALAMLAPGGVVLWHDYDPGNRDVFAYLNTLSKTLPIVHLADTSLAAYRRD